MITASTCMHVQESLTCGACLRAHTQVHTYTAIVKSEVIQYILHMHMMPRATPKHPAALMGRTALVAGITHLVGVQRTVQKNSNVNSEPKYLACE